MEGSAGKKILQSAAEIAKNATAVIVLLSILMASVGTPVAEYYVSHHLDPRYIPRLEAFAELNERYATRGDLIKAVEYTEENTAMIIQNRKTFRVFCGMVENLHTIKITRNIERLLKDGKAKPDMQILRKYMIDLKGLQVIEARCRIIYGKLETAHGN